MIKIKNFEFDGWNNKIKITINFDDEDGDLARDLYASLRDKMTDYEREFEVIKDERTD